MTEQRPARVVAASPASIRSRAVMQLVSLNNVAVDARLAQPVNGPTGLPLLHVGVSLKSEYLEMLRGRGVHAVWVEDPDTSDIANPSPLSPELRARVTAHIGQAFTNLSEKTEGLRASYIAVAKHEMESSRFADAIESTIGDGGLHSIALDMDGMLDELKGQQVLTGLNSIKTHDSYTFQHSIDVTIMGLVLARSMKWDRERLKSFGIGCMLHDIGKLFIDPALLNKTGRLTGAEYEQFKAHPQIGYEVIKALAEQVGVLAPLVAYQHHEKQDGTGYPRGLRGTNRLGHKEQGKIHDFGSIAAVADVYDAMTSHRPYRAGWSPERALGLIKEGTATHFNRQAVAMLLATAPPYPVFSGVIVRSGRYSGWSGIVSEVSRVDLTRPTVRLLYRDDGQRVSPVEVMTRRDADIALEAVEPPSPIALTSNLAAAA